MSHCLGRATQALRVGNLDAAESALAEAAQLDPSDPKVKQLDSQIALLRLGRGSAPGSLNDHYGSSPDVLPEDLAPAAPFDRELFQTLDAPAAGRWFLAAILVIVLSGAVGWYWVRDSAGISGPGDAALRTPAASNRDQPALVSEADKAPSGADRTTAGREAGREDRSGANTPSESLIGRGDAREDRRSTIGITGTAPQARPGSEPTTERTSGAGADRRPSLPAVGPAPVTEGSPSAVGVPSVDGTRTAPSAQPASSDTSEPAGSETEPTRESEDAAAAMMSAPRGVEIALRRYEQASRALDAEAVSAVWPSVNRDALARSFGDLESLRFTLDNCRVSVSGESARADCSGNAEWQTKRGGAPQTARRQWSFDLRDTGGDWIITAARVR